MADIIYKTNKGNEDNILEHLEACDKNFVPPLSQRIDLKVYSEKLAQYATNFEAWSDHKTLVGLISVYMNDYEKKTAYITSVSVCTKFTGRGIAKSLMAECINKARQIGFLQIKLEVNEFNTPAIKLYSAFGFNVAEINKGIIKMNLKIQSNDKE